MPSSVALYLIFGNRSLCEPRADWLDRLHPFLSYHWSSSGCLLCIHFYTILGIRTWVLMSFKQELHQTNHLLKPHFLLCGFSFLIPPPLSLSFFLKSMIQPKPPSCQPSSLTFQNAWTTGLHHDTWTRFFFYANLFFPM